MALNKRMELTRKLGATFDYQQKLIRSKARYRKIVKARQIGITTALGIEKLVDAILRDNYVIIIVSPSFRQSQRMMRYIKRAFTLLERKYGMQIPTQKWTNEEVYFHHGSEIHSLPNNPRSIQGFDCDDGIIDEAGLLPMREGEDIIDALVGSLAAKQGRLTISGRPRGKQGLLWNYFDPTNPRGKDFEAFKITWKDRARLDPKYGQEVEKHRKILTKLQFAEIYDAEFVDEGILVFPHVMLEASQDLWRTKQFVLMTPDGSVSQDTLTYMGIDFGRKISRTEITTIQKVDEDLLKVLTMKGLSNVNFEEQKTIIDDMIGRLRPVIIEIDERGIGLPLLDYMQVKYGENRVKPLRLTNMQTKERAILQLRNAIADLRLAIPEDEELYNQLHAYQKDFTDAGNIRYTGKVTETDFMDDKVIALAAAVDAAQIKPFNFGIV